MARSVRPLTQHGYMTTDEKLAAILAAVQTDPGNRGLARDPVDNLFTAYPNDFAAACRKIAILKGKRVDVITGFFIPTAEPPCGETDGPLGAVFLARAFHDNGIDVGLFADPFCVAALHAGVVAGRISDGFDIHPHGLWMNRANVEALPDLLIAIERVGPATDGRCYTMRGRDITDEMLPFHVLFQDPKLCNTIGIGDGGNEIGMGKVPHETIVKNIPNGDLIHCRVATDHLIVAGVSNWGAYALAAGVYVLRGKKPPADLFDPDREREILEVMVREGPLVDGVTGKQTATVDGLTWDEYTRPLIRIREVLES